MYILPIIMLIIVKIKKCVLFYNIGYFMCNFSREHIVLSYKKWCEHRIRKKQQIKSTAHDGKSYLK